MKLNEKLEYKSSDKDLVLALAVGMICGFMVWYWAPQASFWVLLIVAVVSASAAYRASLEMSAHKRTIDEPKKPSSPAP